MTALTLLNLNKTKMRKDNTSLYVTFMKQGSHLQFAFSSDRESLKFLAYSRHLSNKNNI